MKRTGGVYHSPLNIQTTQTVDHDRAVPNVTEVKTRWRMIPWNLYGHIAQSTLLIITIWNKRTLDRNHSWPLYHAEQNSPPPRRFNKKTYYVLYSIAKVAFITSTKRVLPTQTKLNRNRQKHKIEDIKANPHVTTNSTQQKTTAFRKRRMDKINFPHNKK